MAATARTLARMVARHAASAPGLPVLPTVLLRWHACARRTSNTVTGDVLSGACGTQTPRRSSCRPGRPRLHRGM